MSNRIFGVGSSMAYLTSKFGRYMDNESMLILNQIWAEKAAKQRSYREWFNSLSEEDQFKHQIQQTEERLSRIESRMRALEQTWMFYELVEKIEIGDLVNCSLSSYHKDMIPGYNKIAELVDIDSNIYRFNVFRGRAMNKTFIKRGFILKSQINDKMSAAKTKYQKELKEKQTVTKILLGLKKSFKEWKGEQNV